MSNLYIVGPKDKGKYPLSNVINTTSRSDNWSRGLSPFFLGPCKTYDGYISRNVENLWQSSKVYRCHLDDNGNPSSEYFEWRNKICDDSKAQRYPMGKGAKPEYSYWNGKKLTYVEARKKIYIPIYYHAVKGTPAFFTLKMMYEIEDKDIYLWDFDGYNHKEIGMTYDDVVNSETKKMGHGFVLGMILENKICEYLKL